MSYMNFRNFQLKYFLINMLVLLMYPFYRYLANNNSILAFSDACTIIALLLLIISAIVFLINHGDLDITMYIANRSFQKDHSSFSEFKQKAEEKRKDSFNYPLLCAITLFFIAYITSLFA